GVGDAGEKPAPRARTRPVMVSRAADSAARGSVSARAAEAAPTNGARTRRPSSASKSSVGEGTGRGSQGGGGTGGGESGSGVGALTDPGSSTLPTPSIMQWWALVTLAKLP